MTALESVRESGAFAVNFLPDNAADIRQSARRGRRIGDAERFEAQPISFAGLPVVVAPVHADGRMPAGVQIIAPRWREDRALAVAAALERGAVSTAPIAKPMSSRKAESAS